MHGRHAWVERRREGVAQLARGVMLVQERRQHAGAQRTLIRVRVTVGVRVGVRVGVAVTVGVRAGARVRAGVRAGVRVRVGARVTVAV